MKQITELIQMTS